MEKESEWTFSELLAEKHTEWIENEHDEKLRKICPAVATWKERKNNTNEYPICYGRVGCLFKQSTENCPLIGGAD